MEKLLRTGTLKRNPNDTGDANPNFNKRVVTFLNIIGLLLKLKRQAVQRKNTVGNMKVHIWNWGLFSVVMRVNRPHMLFVL
jgi:hypothetical protein